MLALKRTRIEVKISKNSFFIIRILPILLGLSEKNAELQTQSFGNEIMNLANFCFLYIMLQL